MGQSSSQSANEIFHEYLISPELEQEDLLAKLVVEIAYPIVTRVIRRRLSGWRGIRGEDVEDVCSEAIATLIPRLRAMRSQTAAIEDVESYVAGLAGHVAFQFFARRFPERSRLRNRVRYVLSTDARFRITKSEQGSALCSLARWDAKLQPVAASVLEQCRRILDTQTLPTARLSDLLHAILSEIPGAIEIGDLTALSVGILGLDDRAEVVENLAETLVDPKPAHSQRLELRDRLRMLWIEITELPITQRVALLANLRSTAGACAWLLIELRVVNFRDLAACMGLSPEGLAMIWNRLPLEDSEIAARWGLERQQVINMRSAARQRLGRRMKIREESTSTGNTLRNLPTI